MVTCGGQPLDYPEMLQSTHDLTRKLLDNPDRFQLIQDRKDISSRSLEDFKASLLGRYATEHKGYAIMKDSYDLTIVQRMLWEVRPATIIEMGTYTGSSALWMADVMKMMDIDDCRIYTMDHIKDCLYKDIFKDYPSISFLHGDANNVKQIFSDSLMRSVRHPLVIIEDCHTNVRGILDFFDAYMESGDYFIVEDANPNIPFKVEMVTGEEEYEAWGDWKLKVLKAFLKDKKGQYCVDSFFTDMFGYNCTWNWHGYIRKMF